MVGLLGPRLKVKTLLLQSLTSLDLISDHPAHHSLGIPLRPHQHSLQDSTSDIYTQLQIPAASNHGSMRRKGRREVGEQQHQKGGGGEAMGRREGDHKQFNSLNRTKNKEANGDIVNTYSLLRKYKDHCEEGEDSKINSVKKTQSGGGKDDIVNYLLEKERSQQVKDGVIDTHSLSRPGRREKRAERAGGGAGAWFGGGPGDYREEEYYERDVKIWSVQYQPAAQPARPTKKPVKV